MKKLVIFDFDGTIANSLENSHQIYERLGAYFKLKNFTKEEVEDNKHLSYPERLKFHGISIFHMPFLIKKTREIVGEYIEHTQPFDGIKALCQRLKKEGYAISIISSNLAKNIHQFNEINQMPKFDLITGKASYFGKAKVIKKHLRKFKVKSCIYVGDETRDIVAMQQVNIPMIAVTWGFDSKESLEVLKPTYIVSSMIELYETINLHYKGDQK
jgi:phosphoglycolate phosphatase